jgi:predicted AlkP superfamily phosphohydrolase/phosphomutase
MPRLLLIGWDAADWKTIDRLVDQGDMPIMKGLIERGTRGNLTTLHPVLSPMLWTSIATGKRPFKHGIHGFAEPDPPRAPTTTPQHRRLPPYRPATTKWPR